MLTRSQSLRARAAAALFFGAIVLVTPQTPRAHPHAFLDVGLGIVISEAKVTALDITWLFDDADTEIAVDNNDADGDGKLDETELRSLAERMGRTTGQFGFHIHLFLDDKRLKTEPVTDFRLSMREKRLEARFRAKLAEPIDPLSRKLLIGLYDETFWIQFTLDPARDIAVEGVLPQGCRLETFRDRRTVIYEMVGQKIHPTVTEIACGQ